MEGAKAYKVDPTFGQMDKISHHLLDATGRNNSVYSLSLNHLYIIIPIRKWFSKVLKKGTEKINLHFF